MDLRRILGVVEENGDQFSVTYADITRDGFEEAIVEAVLMPPPDEGGNTVSSLLQVYGMLPNDREPLRLLALGPGLGDGPFEDVVTLGDVRVGAFTTKTRHHLPDDAHCCPSLELIDVWMWNGRAFVSDPGQQIQRRITEP